MCKLREEMRRHTQSSPTSSYGGQSAGRQSYSSPGSTPPPTPRSWTTSSQSGSVDEAAVYRPSRSPQQWTGSRIHEMRCFNCDELGHIKRDCPYRPSSAASGSWSNSSSPRQGGSYVPPSPERRNEDSSAGAMRTSRGPGRGSPAYVRVKIGRRTYRSLLDSGADTTLIPAKMVNEDGIYSPGEPQIAANGTSIPVLGWTTMTASIGRIPTEISGLVTDHVTELMLGMNWLRENLVTWNFVTGEIILGDEVIQLETVTLIMVNVCSEEEDRHRQKVRTYHVVHRCSATEGPFSTHRLSMVA